MTIEPYQLFEPLTAEEYDALKADIARRGVMVPIEVDDDGNVLDGHHRLRICQELGIDPPTIVRSGMSEDDKTEHVLKINLLRRHLGPIAWADAFHRLAEARGVRFGKGKGDPTGKTAKVAVLAAEVGVPPRTARRWLRVAAIAERDLAEHADLRAQLESGELPYNQVLRQARDRDARHIAPIPPPDVPWYSTPQQALVEAADGSPAQVRRLIDEFPVVAAVPGLLEALEQFEAADAERERIVAAIDERIRRLQDLIESRDWHLRHEARDAFQDWARDAAPDEPRFVVRYTDEMDASGGAWRKRRVRPDEPLAEAMG